MEAFEKRIPLKTLLLRDVRVNRHLSERQIDELLDPARYTGLAARFVDRVTRTSTAA
jgi:adenylosuccinate lyase